MEEYFLDFAKSVALVIAVTQFMKTYIFKTEGWYTQLLSWFVSIAIAFIGYSAELGWFINVTEWYWAVLWGVGVGAAANGIFDFTMIQMIINFLVGLFPTPVQKVFLLKRGLVY